MNTEYEAKFKIKDKDEFRELLKAKDAKLITPERLMRRALTGKDFAKGKWLRLRDEGNKVTLTFKDRSEESIGGTKEVEVEVSDFEKTMQILELSNLPIFAYQENKRESWIFNGAQIEIDTWPGVRPYAEIEGNIKEHVLDTAKELGFNGSDAFYDPPDSLYAEQNGISQEEALKVFEDLRFN